MHDFYGFEGRAEIIGGRFGLFQLGVAAPGAPAPTGLAAGRVTGLADPAAAAAPAVPPAAPIPPAGGAPPPAASASGGFTANLARFWRFLSPAPKLAFGYARMDGHNQGNVIIGVDLFNRPFADGWTWWLTAAYHDTVKSGDKALDDAVNGEEAVSVRADQGGRVGGGVSRRLASWVDLRLGAEAVITDIDTPCGDRNELDDATRSDREEATGDGRGGNLDEADQGRAVCGYGLDNGATFETDGTSVSLVAGAGFEFYPLVKWTRRLSLSVEGGLDLYQQNNLGSTDDGDSEHTTSHLKSGELNGVVRWHF